METPLEGLRVLDFTRVLAGPHCTKMFADMGAEVIKVEPPAGDITRFAQPRRNSIPGYFAQQNTGKRCISVDLSRPEGVELALELVEHCDIVVENYRPGVMDRLGLGYETVAARNPRIIFASISGYGQTGPWRHRLAYAAVIHAEVGLTKSQGDQRDGVYENDRHSHADIYTSLETAAGILAALYQRERTGRGQWIDISMAATLLYVNEHTNDDLWEGEIDPGWIRSMGNEHHVVVEVLNGDHVIVAGHPAQNGTFEMYLQSIGRPELADDPRFLTQADRLAHLDDLKRYVVDFGLTQPDADSFEACFAPNRLAVGAIRSVADVADTDWAEQRDVVRDVDDRGGGRIRLPNSPWRFSDAPRVGVGGTPRYRGEDNAEVLGDLLGMSDDNIAGLTDDGVLSAHRPSRNQTDDR
jgi:crotonobetainyl-CoA:carnitine CoA-transferase CaiB-like acyl-CoA transferase